MLRELLRALKKQTISQNDYELIVVDNASSSQTKAVVDNISEDFQNLGYYYEPELGLSRARNLGIEKAKGEIIVFTDDDALPEPDWLEVIVQTFADFSPAPVCVGGKILPKWESPKPGWLPNNKKLQHLSLLDWGDQPVWLRTPSLFAGNLAVNRLAFSKIGKFEGSLGRKGEDLLSAEEALFLFLVLQEYGTQSLLYQPKAVVHHRIPKEKIATRSYIIRRSFWDGVSKARMRIIISRRRGISKPEIYRFRSIWYREFGVILESALIMVKGGLVGLLAVVSLNRKKFTECLIDWAYGTGGLIELGKFIFLLNKGGKLRNESDITS
jgi:glycosyltransferase involved in cell wall biosynthesis